MNLSSPLRRLSSGSGQCSSRLEEKDVNMIDRENYGYYIGLQALDGLSLNHTRDFTSQYEEDPTDERLWNGDMAVMAMIKAKQWTRMTQVERGQSPCEDYSEKKDQGTDENMKEDKRKAKAKEDGNDDDDDDGDGGGEDNKDNDEGNGNGSDSDEESDIDMYIDMDVEGTDETAWYQSVVAFGVPNADRRLAQ